MRNAAQNLAIKATRDQETTSTVKLPSSGAPVAVGVSYDGVSKLLFSYDGQTGDKLSWEAGGYALVINFFWSGQPFDELFAQTPACWFAKKVPRDDGAAQQTCCVPPVPGWYHIAAEVPDPSQTTGNGKKVVDPVIVVTPIITP